MQYFIGLDPGVSGGMALINEKGSPVMVEKVEGKTQKEFLDTLREMTGYAKDVHDVHAMIEDVGKGSPKGVKPVTCEKCKHVNMTRANLQKPETQITLGSNWGSLQMALIALAIPWEMCSIRDWQSAMGVYGVKKKKVEKKRYHKSVAQQLFPSVKVTLYLCDALLIAEYCRRQLALANNKPF